MSRHPAVAAVARFLTLYAALVLTSAGVLVGVKGLEFLEAVAVAALACVFKTFAATLHGRVWQYLGG